MNQQHAAWRFAIKVLNTMKNSSKEDFDGRAAEKAANTKCNIR
jgi:hypothetical protein